MRYRKILRPLYFHSAFVFHGTMVGMEQALPHEQHAHRRIKASYLRNFVFGVEDSLVSTVGLISGVAAAGVSRGTIITTGIVLVFVEAFSMAVGSFLSEESAEQYLHKGEADTTHSPVTAIIMFISYFISGFIPLFPYTLWQVSSAFWLSIGFSLIALFALGFVSGKMSHSSAWKTAVKMTVFGGIAIGLGVIVGWFMDRGINNL